MNEEHDEEENSGSAVGGMVRSITRNFRSMLKKSRKLPRVPPKVVASSADKLGDLVEISDHIRTAHEQAKRDLSSKSQQTSTQSKGFLSGRYKYFTSLFTNTMPPFMKSTIMGTAVFSVYEEFIYHSADLGLFNINVNTNNIDCNNTDVRHNISTKACDHSDNYKQALFVASCGGGLAGSVQYIAVFFHSLLFYCSICYYSIPQ